METNDILWYVDKAFPNRNARIDEDGDIVFDGKEPGWIVFLDTEGLTADTETVALAEYHEESDTYHFVTDLHVDRWDNLEDKIYNLPV